jgi:hypothetical protein
MLMLMLPRCCVSFRALLRLVHKAVCAALRADAGAWRERARLNGGQIAVGAGCLLGSSLLSVVLERLLPAATTGKSPLALVAGYGGAAIVWGKIVWDTLTDRLFRRVVAQALPMMLYGMLVADKLVPVFASREDGGVGGGGGLAAAVAADVGKTLLACAVTSVAEAVTRPTLRHVALAARLAWLRAGDVVELPPWWWRPEPDRRLHYYWRTMLDGAEGADDDDNSCNTSHERHLFVVLRDASSSNQDRGFLAVRANVGGFVHRGGARRDDEEGAGGDVILDEDALLLRSAPLGGPPRVLRSSRPLARLGRKGAAAAARLAYDALLPDAQLPDGKEERDGRSLLAEYLEEVYGPSARAIQHAWRRAICDPGFYACRARLAREWDELRAHGSPA